MSFYRGYGLPERTFRAGGRGNDLPGRNRRNPPFRSGEAAQGPPGEGVRAGGRDEIPFGRRKDPVGDEPGPEGGGRGGKVPRRFLSQAHRIAVRTSAPFGTPGRDPPPGGVLLGKIRGIVRKAGPR